MKLRKSEIILTIINEVLNYNREDQYFLDYYEFLVKRAYFYQIEKLNFISRKAILNIQTVHKNMIVNWLLIWLLVRLKYKENSDYFLTISRFCLLELGLFSWSESSFSLLTNIWYLFSWEVIPTLIISLLKYLISLISFHPDNFLS